MTVNEIQTVARDAFRQRPVLLLPILVPILATVAVALFAPVLHVVAAAIVALIVAVPAAVVAWASGLSVGENQERESKDLAQIARTRLQKRLAISLQDSESHLYADWYLTLRFEEEIQRARRYGQPLSILMMAPSGAAHANRLPDLSGLGHALKRHLRSSDVAGPVPDDQIAIVLPSTGVQRSRQARRRLQPVAARFGYAIGTATLVTDAADREGLVDAALDNIRQRQKRKRAA